MSRTISAEAETLVSPPPGSAASTTSGLTIPDQARAYSAASADAATIALDAPAPPDAPTLLFDTPGLHHSLPERVLQRARRIAATRSPVLTNLQLRSLSGQAPFGEARTLISRFLERPLFGRQGDDRAARVWKAIQGVELLAGVSPGELQACVTDGSLDHQILGRDRLLAADGRSLIVLSGQLALGAFAPTRLADEIAAQAAYVPGDKASEYREFQRRDREGPMIRVAARGLMWFEAGDVINVDAVRQLVTARAPVGLSLALFTVTPAVILSISPAALLSLLRGSQALAQRIRKGTEAVTRRIGQSGGPRDEIVSFFLRNGMSVASRLRVVDLDRCTFCRECEQACAERYGVARLNVEGKILGAWGFADSCRTCVDQRCVHVCDDNAIRFDERLREVIINEEACTGCSMCSLACPYDAIKMHVLSEAPRLAELLQLRINKDRAARDEARPFVPPKSRFRVANKCDHCVGHGGEQACITACTKDALLDLSPKQVFFDEPSSLSRPAQPSYPAAELDAHQTELYDVRLMGAGPGPARRRPFGRLWLLSLLGVFLVLGELLLRYTRPAYSLLARYLHLFEHMSPLRVEAYLRQKPFAPGDGLALSLGIGGTALMVGAFLYSAATRVPALRRRDAPARSPRALARELFGAVGFHVWAGTIGPLLILVHTAGHLRSQYQVASVALWSMIATVVAGLAARYFASGIFTLAAQARLEATQVTARLTQLRQEAAGVGGAEVLYNRLCARYESVAPKGGETTWIPGKQRQQALPLPPAHGMGAAGRALAILLSDELARIVRPLRLRLALSTIRDPAIRKEVAALISRRAYLKRQELLLPALRPIFQVLRLLHIPLALLLALATLLHILNPRL